MTAPKEMWIVLGHHPQHGWGVGFSPKKQVPFVAFEKDKARRLAREVQEAQAALKQQKGMVMSLQMFHCTNITEIGFGDLLD